MRLRLRNNIIRNIIKDLYYKYFFYKIPIKWKKDYLEAEVRGQKIKLAYTEVKPKNYYSSKYYSPELITILNELEGYFKHYIPLNGDYVIDCGAYEGGMVIIMSRLVGPNGKVLAFEPFKDALKVLKKNIELNDLKNVTIIEKGVWNRECYLPFLINDVGSRIDNDGETVIEVTTLDEELNNLGIPLNKIKYVKMDIEGAEIQALEGCKNLMINGAKFAIASYHIVNEEQTYKKLEQIFSENDYFSVTEYPLHLTTYGEKNENIKNCNTRL
jgi:FkbM family methyltransferase